MLPFENGTGRSGSVKKANMSNLTAQIYRYSVSSHMLPYWVTLYGPISSFCFGVLLG